MSETSASTRHDWAAFLKGRDSPPVWSFFIVSALYCEKGLMAFFVQAVVDVWMRLRHGPRSLAAHKLAMTCLVREVSRLFMAPTPQNLEQARSLLADAKARSEPGMLAPVHALEGRLLLLLQQPPRPKEALQAFERCMAVLEQSPYLAVCCQLHNTFFAAAMAAVLSGKVQRAREFYEAYRSVTAGKPRRRWAPESEQDLERRMGVA